MCKLLFYIRFVSCFKFLIIMKRIHLAVISLMCGVFAYSQEKNSGTILRVEPSGIVVYKPVDMEQTLGIKSEAVVPVTEERIVPVRTLDDLSVEELEERLYYIELKLEKAINEDNTDDIIRYKEEKQQTEARIQNNKQKTK